MILLGFVIAIGGGIIIGSFLPEGFGATSYPAYIPFSITSFLTMCANITVLLILPLTIIMLLFVYLIKKIDDFDKRQNFIDFGILIVMIAYMFYVVLLEKTELIYRFF